MRAAIDIGTNTVLLLVGEQVGNKIRVIREEQRLPRLGKGTDASGNLNGDSIARVIAALQEYRYLLLTEYPECRNVIVTATSAVRDAANKSEFATEVKNKTGFRIKILSGEEESDYTFVGAVSALAAAPEVAQFMVLDIGGGSTEIATGSTEGVSNSHSYNMGCVRFTERYLLHNPPASDEIAECRRQVRQLLAKNEVNHVGEPLVIGVGGTLTTLAAMVLKLDFYDAAKVNELHIAPPQIESYIRFFSEHTHEENLKLSPNLLKGREDIFLAGLLILDEFLHHFGIDSITISTGGIRHGALILNNF